MQKYFKGWYFKQQNGKECTAFIPAFHIGNRNERSASVQVVTDEATYCADYVYGDFSSDKSGLPVKIGGSTFTECSINLNIKTDEVTATGSLEFGPLTPVKYDIMGPFKYVPFMECRHSVISMTHRVNGSVLINGKQIDYSDGTGYIESDRGTSFPKRYAWTQCCWHDESPCSVMLSVADIPFLGGSFTGIIGAVSWEGHEYRIATYLGAKVVFLYRGRITVVQDKYMLTAELIDKRELQLRAPVSGSMVRLIRENPSCKVRYCFSHRDRILFDFVSGQASFEYEYERQ